MARRNVVVLCSAIVLLSVSGTAQTEECLSQADFEAQGGKLVFTHGQRTARIKQLSERAPDVSYLIIQLDVVVNTDGTPGAISSIRVRPPAGFDPAGMRDYEEMVLLEVRGRHWTPPILNGKPVCVVATVGQGIMSRAHEVAAKP